MLDLVVMLNQVNDSLPPITARIQLTAEELRDAPIEEVVTIALVMDGVKSSISIPSLFLNMLMARVMGTKDQVKPKFIMPDTGLVGFTKGN
jgi:hypothetical protein